MALLIISPTRESDLTQILNNNNNNTTSFCNEVKIAIKENKKWLIPLTVGFLIVIIIILVL